ncbi:MAG: ROK family protein [Acidobacteria bacterium]|nr:MAG: ROK family protein [Acidobacteriota bacterium]
MSTNSRYTIGVDLGGTNLRVAAVDPEGAICERINLDTEVKEGRLRVVADMCDAVKEIEQRLPEAQLGGIGIGVPGIINLADGTVRQSPNLPGWSDFPVRDDIEQLLGTQVVLENDANAAALGESWVGAGRNVNSLCMMTLGTGIGGGLILDGRIWHGREGMAGELGHMTIDPNGALCGCGNLGCVEAYASASAISRMAMAAVRVGRSPELARDADELGDLTAEIVYIKAKQGDTVAREVFEMVGRSLGVAIANLINIFNLPLYVVGGGVANGWDAFAPSLMAEVHKRSLVARSTNPTIVPSALGADAGLVGAAHLPQIAEEDAHARKRRI